MFDLSQTEFEANFEHIEFDDILHHVVPQIELVNNNGTTSLSLQQSKRDMIFFFKWLKLKKVRRIIKVTVDDMGEISHSNEAIEEALSDFHIEVLH